jgi:hypothetical protein
MNLQYNSSNYSEILRCQSRQGRICRPAEPVQAWGRRFTVFLIARNLLMRNSSGTEPQRNSS